VKDLRGPEIEEKGASTRLGGRRKRGWCRDLEGRHRDDVQKTGGVNLYELRLAGVGK